MKSFDYTIKDEVGIHARPAGELSKAAKNFNSKISLEFNGKKAELNRLIAVMSLGIKQNDTITVTAEGLDEDMAIDEMKRMFERNL